MNKTVVLSLICVGLLKGPAEAGAIADAKRWVRTAIERICSGPDLNGFDAQLAVPGSWVVDERRNADGPPVVRTLVRLSLPEGGELRLERRAVNGMLQQFRARYGDGVGRATRPLLLAIADANCIIRSARSIRYVSAAEAYLDQLDETLTNVRWSETLQAPWPEGADPGGPRVALVDTGLAYDLELFRDNLARDEHGDPLGYDFWDLDPWPYDGDTARGPFFPVRHGTAVASVIVREAPDVALIPFRFPRPDLTRMPDVVARAAASGARIIAMPLGSDRREDWTAFANALDAHDILAIVSAGNDGRDIDEVPVYPAALGHPNIITVTSADPFGRLADGSNWGAESVDIMLPAENVPVVDFRGASGVASGSSYAVPRLAALAVRILAEMPNLSAAALKAEIGARASAPVFERAGMVAMGWIANPAAD